MRPEQVQLALDDAPQAADRAHPATAEQRAAIDSRHRDVFCEAGAGTGKTLVLVERYCEAIATDDVGPDAMLAFTFTERAAAELRARIRAELAARSRAAREGGEEELAIRLGRAARDTERALVTTIHGFCRRLLASHPAAAGIDPRFRVLDESEAGRLRRRALAAAIDDVLRSGAPERVEVVAAYEPWRIGQMALTAYERLRSQGMSEPELPPAPEPVRSRKGSDDDATLSPAEREGAIAARDALAALLAAFHHRYQELKDARAALDFSDLELRALGLLRSQPAVAQLWRERFAHVLVDEFQDTNSVQLDLVEELRGPQARVFRVGDELQSIYRFRNADLAVFREERERAEADPETLTLPLTGNFRSRPGVVAAANALGEALIGDGFRRLAHHLPERHPGAPEAELLLTPDGGADGWAAHGEALGGPPSVSQPRVIAEARFLARRLRELVDAGEARAGDVVVLLRAFTHVDAYEEALERAGLDPYVVGGRGYWTQQQVEDMLRLLGCVANPLDDEMLLGALANPALGVSPDALWLLRRASQPDPDEGPGEGEAPARRDAAPHLWPLVAWRFGGGERRPREVDERWLEEIAAADAGRLERFCATLGGLRSAAPLLALDELVERTLSDFGYDLALLARPGGRGRMANVRKLIRLAREFEAHEGRDLRAFLAAAEELAERDEREGLAATQAEDHDGVRIMTVHAAKGLEFPVVAVPDLGRGLSRGERGGDVVIGRLAPGDEQRAARFGLRLVLADADSLGAWELHELHAESIAEAAAEGCRVVHVAATRAEERLILSGRFKPGDCEPGEPGPGDSPLRRLLPELARMGWDPERDGVVELPAAPPAAGVAPAGAPAWLAVRLNPPGPRRAELLAERLAPLRAPERAAGGQGAPPLGRPERVLPVGHLSYSALAEYERCPYRFFSERLLGLEPPPSALHPQAGGGEEDGDGPGAAPDARSRRLALGNAVHAALEWSGRRGWERPPAALVEALLAGQGIGDDPTAAELAVGLVGAWLDSSLRADLGGAAVRTEVPFAIGVDGTVIRGQIDLLAPGAEATVVDYKTDALGDRGAEELGARYGAQRRLYALAVASADAAVERVRAVHCFLEAPEAPVAEVFDRAALDAARADLERLVAEIRHGGFEPTPEPSWAVCNGCPAAARLCPHPGWRPPRGAGAAAR